MPPIPISGPPPATIPELDLRNDLHDLATAVLEYYDLSRRLTAAGGDVREILEQARAKYAELVRKARAAIAKLTP